MKHSFEVLANRSNAYEFIDFDKQTAVEWLNEELTFCRYPKKGILEHKTFN